MHVSEQFISILMTLLTQHSATEDKSPFQNYSPFLKWTWYIDSLGQRAWHSHVTCPYQLLAMLLNHPTPYFSVLTPAALYFWHFMRYSLQVLVISATLCYSSTNIFLGSLPSCRLQHKHLVVGYCGDADLLLWDRDLQKPGYLSFSTSCIGCCCYSVRALPYTAF